MLVYSFEFTHKIVRSSATLSHNAQRVQFYNISYGSVISGNNGNKHK